MSLIPFPNVPNVPGVPSLLRTATVPSVDALVNKGVSALVEAIFGKEEWGIYKDGKEVFTSNSLSSFSKSLSDMLPAGLTKMFDTTPTFLSIEFKNLYQVSNFIQEEGAFASYNKVGTPYDCRVRIAVGEDAATREKFLNKLESMLKSTDLYGIVTPDATYADATLQNYQYRRTEKNGARIIVADLWFVEVRKYDKSKKKVTAEPQAEDMSFGGQQQAQFLRETQDAQFFQKVGDNLETFGALEPGFDVGTIGKVSELRWPVL